MSQPQSSELDLIEELKLRTWARENYVAADQRNASWHPVVLDEMSNRDRESGLNVEVHHTVQPSANPGDVLSRLRRVPATPPKSLKA